MSPNRGHLTKDKARRREPLNELGPYLLPVRLDDSILPGLRPTVSYIDESRVIPQNLAKLIIDKLADAPGVASPSPPIAGVPRTVEEQRQLLTERPPAWEFLLYASVLLRRRADIEPKWRDHEIRYAPRTGKYMADKKAVRYLRSAMTTAGAIIGGINRVLDSDAQVAAFGAPGQPGNPERIEHLATRLISVYEELLDWARNLRGISVSERVGDTFELGARLVDMPIQQIRDFVDDYVAEMEKIPELLNRGEKVGKVMTLKLGLDNDTLSALTESLDSLEVELF